MGKMDKNEKNKNKKNRNSIVSIRLFLLILLVFESVSLVYAYKQSQQQLSYEIEVAVVDIPVYVTDKSGNPVYDLKIEDFMLFVDGSERKITYFNFIRNDDPQVNSLLRQFPAARRHFLLFFDLSFITPKGILNARKYALNFVKEKVQPYDLVSVVIFSGYSGLKVVANFTNDKNWLKKSIETLGLSKATQRMRETTGFNIGAFINTQEDNQDKRNLSEDKFQEYLSDILEKPGRYNEKGYSIHVSNLLDQLKNLGNALDVIQGRKHVIFFSEGFDSRLIGPKGDSHLRNKLFDSLNKIIESDCLIHSVDPGGLFAPGAMQGIPLKSRQAGQDTLFLLSDTTGGRTYKNVNNLDKPLEDILKLTNSYYLIGFTSRDKDREVKYHKIKVKLKKPGLIVSHRKGYYEKKKYKEYSDLGKQFQLAEFVTKDIIQNDILFYSFVSSFHGEQEICQIPVFLELPCAQFFEEKKGSDEIQLEIYGLVTNSKGQYIDFFSQILKYNPEVQADKIKTQKLKYYDMLLVPPENYKVKFIIRNSQTGEIGSHIKQISVPDYMNEQLSLSTPVFIDFERGYKLFYGYNPENPDERKIGMPVFYPFTIENEKFMPIINPVIEKYSPTQVYFRVYRNKSKTNTDLHQLEVEFKIFDKNGNSIIVKGVDLVKGPHKIDSKVFSYLFVFDLVEPQSGLYQLQVTLTDTLNKQIASSRTPFFAIKE